MTHYYHDKQINRAEEALRGRPNKAELEAALRGVVEAANYYKKLAVEADPIMVTIKRMISDQIEDRIRD